MPRDQVGRFYTDLLNKPQPLNHDHTINEYWLEDSYGLLGIDMEPFGPYRMDRPEYQYGLAEYGQEDGVSDRRDAATATSTPSCSRSPLPTSRRRR